jgi:uncharacterized Fe-S center protein
MAKVYFMNDRSQSLETSLVAKTTTLFDKAEFGKMINPGDVVAIKLHMGEYNNTAYIRPVYISALVEKVKSLGGNPMVVDTTTLPYSPFASRATALDHLNTIARNGFTQGVLGCPVVIADGYIGTDDMNIDLPEGFILKEQYIASAIGLADCMIMVSHFKGHPMGTYGGAIKNTGVGCASKRGKLNLHLGGHPVYGLRNRPWLDHLCTAKECPTWELCDNVCPVHAIKVLDTGATFDRDKCIGCLSCVGVAGLCGVAGFPDDYFDVTSAAIADSALAAVKAIGGPEKVGYINLALDISPWCDCVNFSDRPIIPNLGIFASKDPVAIDMACLQKAAESGGMPDSIAMAKGVMDPGLPKLTACGSMMGISEFIQPNVGAKIGLGSKEYELEEVPPLEDPQPFLFTEVPPGIKLAKIFTKKGDIYPEGGFKAEKEVDIEDMR